MADDARGNSRTVTTTTDEGSALHEKMKAITWTTVVGFIVLLGLGFIMACVTLVFLSCMGGHDLNQYNITADFLANECHNTHDVFAHQEGWGAWMGIAIAVFCGYVALIIYFETRYESEISTKPETLLLAQGVICGFFNTMIQFGGLLLEVGIISFVVISALTQGGSSPVSVLVWFTFWYFVIAPLFMLASYIEERRKNAFTSTAQLLESLAWMPSAVIMLIIMIEILWVGQKGHYESHRLSLDTLYHFSWFIIGFWGTVLLYIGLLKCFEYCFKRPFAMRKMVVKTFLLAPVWNMFEKKVAIETREPSNALTEKSTFVLEKPIPHRNFWMECFSLSSLMTFVTTWVIGFCGYFMFPRKNNLTDSVMHVNLSTRLQFEAHTILGLFLVPWIVFVLIWGGLLIYILVKACLYEDGYDAYANHNFYPYFGKKYKQVSKEDAEAEHRVLISGKCKQAPQTVTPMFTL